jgi:glycosyltransferase involved in cell wall biosynthesis
VITERTALLAEANAFLLPSREFVRAGVEGLVVPPSRVEELSDAIASFINRPELIQ